MIEAVAQVGAEGQVGVGNGAERGRQGVVARAGLDLSPPRRRRRHARPDNFQPRELESASQGDGQRVDFGGERTFSELEIEIAGDTVGHRVKYNGISPVGFAEVGLGDIHVE